MADASEPSCPSRRSLLAWFAMVPTLSAAGDSRPAHTDAGHASLDEVRRALKDASGTKLVILGTAAGPVPTVPGRTRHMASHVLVSNAAAYVLDCGLGVTNQFARTGLAFTTIRSILITHHHPDHNIEYGPFLLIGWIQGLPSSVRVLGPPPLEQMTDDLIRAYKATIGFWAEDFRMKPLVAPDVKEVSAPGTVMQDENVRVTAALVEHPPVRPALAYRFDFHDRSITFSGDTVPLETVARLARGADILVHEAMYTPALEAYLRGRIAQGVPWSFDAYMQHMRTAHSPVDEVGRIAQRAGVKTLVLSHLTPGIDGIQDETWRDQAARHFTGEVVVARDLMVL